MYSHTAFCDGYEVVLKGNNKNMYCDKILKTDTTIKCKVGGAAYLYDLSLVVKILQGKDVVYPYKSNKKIKVVDLSPDKCDEILDAVKGPLLLEYNKDVFFVVGSMYENGICVTQNLDLAVYYYQKCGNQGRVAFDHLKEKYYKKTSKKAKLDQKYLDALQQDSNKKRAKKARWDAKCQGECMIKDDVKNKHRYSVKCYNDCMSYMD
jgi:TPR repeat protein